MKTTPEKYKSMVEQASPNSPLLKNMLKAFAFGGAICVLGELLAMLYGRLGAGEELVRSLVPITLIAITAVLTASGVFDKIARHAGAGTIVPITGFANAVVSPAMEFQSEGRILGTGANIFKLAGPVLIYGGGAAALYGLIYWLFTR
ncbi:MAG: SpoVA/SpoVAEb family sporulation membrane protein [Clostridium sp.]|jgi:stage V sporulation protein AC|nr:SpoVA/SpoVAEb family sporulation membrane protein [Clostridium sp.]